MTDNFKRSLGLISICGVILLGVFLWLKHKIEQIVVLPSIPHGSRLAPDDRELVGFDEKTHRVTVTTSSGTIRMYARNPAVHIKKDGRITIDRHLLGFQSRFALGLGYSDTFRYMVGYNPLYWGAFEASVSAGLTLDDRYTFVRPYINGGYNFWGNLILNGGINPVSLLRKEVDYTLFLSVRI